ncbi:hypothetical protein FPL11_04480 [Spiribacter aquaticus]|uniref:Uncharacterized protein n=1 Tax=Spiribacter aquaticus TaxID=1935996 RepID=A0A557RJS7_9GAMM|nr:MULTISPECIES: hypothetical protein [Spiribacter]KAF0280124.1 hypothetical protein BA897_05250 [Spiribacter roseus]TVO65346.1 hypothetical protein FPL11_04480 [Spiribacter aquaticus]
MSSIQWSDTLTNQTRQALESHGLDMLGFAWEYTNFKNADGGYGLMPIDELLMGRFVISRREIDTVESFDTPDAVIEAGWVLD